MQGHRTNTQWKQSLVFLCVFFFWSALTLILQCFQPYFGVGGNELKDVKVTELESMSSSDKLLFILLLYCFFFKTGLFPVERLRGKKSLTQVVTICNTHWMPPGCPMVLPLIHVLSQVDGAVSKCSSCHSDHRPEPSSTKWGTQLPGFPVCSAQPTSEKPLPSFDPFWSHWPHRKQTRQ